MNTVAAAKAEQVASAGSFEPLLNQNKLANKRYFHLYRVMNISCSLFTACAALRAQPRVHDAHFLWQPHKKNRLLPAVHSGI